MVHQAPRPEPARDRRISPHDADAYEQYGHDMDRVAQAIKPLLDMVPPDPFSDDPEELLALAGIGSRLRSLDKRTFHNAIRLLTGSAADFLDDYFESDLLKAWLASSGIIGSRSDPDPRAPASSCSSTRLARPMASSAPGRSTRAATAASPRFWRGRGRVRRGDPDGRARGPSDDRRTAEPPAWCSPTVRS